MANFGRNLKPTKFELREGDPSKILPTHKPDEFGQVYSAEEDLASGKVPSPEQTVRAHARSDVDSAQKAQHHTLGLGRNQAAMGSHTHDGINSKRFIQVGTKLVSFTNLDAFTVDVVFETPFPEGIVPTVMTNIASGAGETIRWDSRAISTSNTQFTLFVFEGDAADPTRTWSNIPVQWLATT